jgi:hypothetical protein
MIGKNGGGATSRIDLSFFLYAALLSSDIAMRHFGAGQYPVIDRLMRKRAWFATAVQATHEESPMSIAPDAH